MISLTDAALHVIEHGEYQGLKVAQLAVTDAGLLEVARLAGLESTHGLDRLYFERFVQDSHIAAQLQALRDKGRAQAKEREAN